MLFYDVKFIVPFVFFYFVYVFTNQENRNKALVVGSAYFYGLWDWRFLGLLMAQVIVDYTMASSIAGTSIQKQKKIYVLISIVFNLGMLCYFKYANFFIDSFLALMPNMSYGGALFINVVLPPAISFYTFESLSYVVDVYRGTAKVERNFWTFSAFILYFPKLVAGPIERAHTLLKKLNEDKIITIENIISGLRLYLWGLFKKLVVGDNLGALADPIFLHPGNYSSSELYMAALCFTFQIYADFSGYTDMARGLSRMMGLELSLNFNVPYLSHSIGEFWRRWHITLGNWIRDYIYIPLGGNRVGIHRQIVNLLVTFFLSGLWHGASWNFVIWGVYYGILLSLEVLLDAVSIKYKPLGKFVENTPKWIKVFITFNLVLFGWVVFRSQKLDQMNEYLAKLFSPDLVPLKQYIKNALYISSSQDLLFNLLMLPVSSTIYMFLKFLSLAWLIILVDSISYKKGSEYIAISKNAYFNSLFYTFLFLGIFIFGETNVKQFIYFQF